MAMAGCGWGRVTTTGNPTNTPCWDPQGSTPSGTPEPDPPNTEDQKCPPNAPANSTISRRPSWPPWGGGARGVFFLVTVVKTNLAEQFADPFRGPNSRRHVFAEAISRRQFADPIRGRISRGRFFGGHFAEAISRTAGVRPRGQCLEQGWIRSHCDLGTEAMLVLRDSQDTLK